MLIYGLSRDLRSTGKVLVHPRTEQICGAGRKEACHVFLDLKKRNSTVSDLGASVRAAKTAGSPRPKVRAARVAEKRC
jgi:hypothetical protein